jgi:putative iron-dependent peroxidase
MLENMFIGRPPGKYDRILDFSTAVTGTLFFIPTSTFLDSVSPDQPSPTACSTQKPAAVSALAEIGAISAATKDGSLGIGSLKGEDSNE